MFDALDIERRRMLPAVASPQLPSVRMTLCAADKTMSRYYHYFTHVDLKCHRFCHAFVHVLS